MPISPFFLLVNIYMLRSLVSCHNCDSTLWSVFWTDAYVVNNTPVNSLIQPTCRTAISDNRRASVQNTPVNCLIQPDLPYCHFRQWSCVSSKYTCKLPHSAGLAVQPFQTIAVLIMSLWPKRSANLSPPLNCTLESSFQLTYLLSSCFQNRASDRVVVDDRKSKSFEEREEQYVEARNRIFQQQHSVSRHSTHLFNYLVVYLPGEATSLACTASDVLKTTLLSAWLSGQDVGVLLSDFSWSMLYLWLIGDHFVAKVSTVGQPSRSTQPSIPPGSVSE